jgi:hypothetical protein
MCDSCPLLYDAESIDVLNLSDEITLKKLCLLSGNCAQKHARRFLLYIFIFHTLIHWFIDHNNNFIYKNMWTKILEPSSSFAEQTLSVLCAQSNLGLEFPDKNEIHLRNRYLELFLEMSFLLVFLSLGWLTLVNFDESLASYATFYSTTDIFLWAFKFRSQRINSDIFSKISDS